MHAPIAPVVAGLAAALPKTYPPRSACGRRWLVVLLLLVPGLALAQVAVPWQLSGQVRHRSELDAKAFAEGADDHVFNLLRTRLGVAVQPLPDVGVFVQIQDARLWGGENPGLGRGTLDGDADALDLHQAYFTVDDLFGSDLGLKVGRQELAYGNERLLGAVGWSNVGRAFDAAVVGYAGEGARVDLLAAKLVDDLGGAAAQNLVGLYGTFALADGHALDLFLLHDNDTEPVQGDGEDAWRLERYTPGLYARGAAGRLDYAAEAAYQLGDLRGADVRAYLLSGTLGAVLVPERALRAAVTYTRLSGDDDLDDDTARTFNTLFGTNHKFYGFMDYFPFTAALRPFGLQDAFVSLGVNVSEGVRLAVDVHHFAAATPLPFEGGQEASVFGQEVDVSAAYRYNERFGVTAGAAAFRPGEAIERVLGDEQTFWAYLMTSVTF